jgi:hypothetical protein
MGDPEKFVADEAAVAAGAAQAKAALSELAATLKARQEQKKAADAKKADEVRKKVEPLAKRSEAVALELVNKRKREEDSEQPKRWKEQIKEEFLKLGEKPRQEKSREDEKPKAEAPRINMFSIELGGAHSPKLNEVVAQAMGALKDSGAEIYQRAGDLMRPLSEPDFNMNGELIKVGDLIQFTEGSLFRELNKYIRFYRWEMEGGEGAKKQPKQVQVNSGFGIGKYLPKQILAARGEWPFPRVTGILNAPTLQHDGTLLYKEGYDRKTGLLLLNIPKLEINPEPTKRDAERALALLREKLFPRTPFADDAARAVALSFLITVIIRPGALPFSPLYLFSSPTSGAGKSFIVEAGHVIATGEPAAPMAECENKEEMNKHLAAQVLQGRSLISLDNVNFSELKSGLLNKVITQMKVAIRLLGKSVDGRVQIRAVVAATGVNLTIADDLDRRTLLCRLDPKAEWTGDRDWGDQDDEREALQVVAQDRLEYLRAILTIPLAYKAAGYPGRLKPLNGFKHWSRLARSPLPWLGEADPCDTMEAARGGDTGRQARYAIYMSLFDVFGDRPCTAANMVEATKSEFERGEAFKEMMRGSFMPNVKQQNLYEALMLVMPKGAKEVSAVDLGIWLRNSLDVPSSRLVLRKDEKKTRTGQVLWKVERFEVNDEGMGIGVSNNPG